MSGARNARFGISLALTAISILLGSAQDVPTRLPKVRFATYLSGSQSTAITASAVDSDGHLYVAGTTAALDFPTTSGAYRRVSSTECCAGFVAKFSRDGSELIYSTLIGLASPTSIAVDRGGNLYMTGNNAGPDFATTQGAWQTTCTASGSRCSFLLKLNAAGSALVYANEMGNAACVPHMVSLAVDSEGSAYPAGEAGVGCYTSATAFKRTLTSGTNAIVMKFAADGRSVAYSTYVGAKVGGETLRAITVAQNKKAIITGVTTTTGFPTSQNAFQRTPKGPSPVYVAKLSEDGSKLLASTLLSGSKFDEAGDVAVDRFLNVYVSGNTNSRDFPVSAGAYRTGLNAGQCGEIEEDFPCSDIFVTKLTPDFGHLIYSTFIGGLKNDVNPRLTLDSVGHAILTAYTESTDFPLSKPTQSDPTNLVIAKLSTGGSQLQFSTYFGDRESQSASGVGVDAAGNVYIAGRTSSPFLPVTPGAYQTVNSSADANAGFAVKIDLPPCTLSPTSPSVTICVPLQGTSQHSPLLISAGATDTRPVTAMKLYIDGVGRFLIEHESHFEVSVSLNSGPHHLTVTAWNGSGQTYRSSVSIVVQ
jgi:hypothetical protein